MTKRTSVSGCTVTHLWHFGCWPAHHFLLPDFLLNKDTGHVEGAQQCVGLEPQIVAFGRQQLQSVQCWIEVVAATQLDQQVHQCFTERGRKRGRESEREGGKGLVRREEEREGVGRKKHRRKWGREGERQGDRRGR